MILACYATEVKQRIWRGGVLISIYNPLTTRMIMIISWVNGEVKLNPTKEARNYVYTRLFFLN